MLSVFRQVRRIAFCLLALYLVFAFTASSLVLLVDPPGGTAYADQIDSARFLSAERGADQIVLIDDRVSAGRARIQLIRQAQKSLDIALHAVKDGACSDTFYAALLEAADRGVQVRLLFDGLFNNLHSASNATRLALIGHPNITLAFYEPFSIFMPWNWNNRLHDKFMVIDQTFAMIGGGNIEDRYCLDDYAGSVVHDLHAVICRDWYSESEESVLDEFDQYFNLLWRSEFSQLADDRLSAHQIIKAEYKKEKLLTHLNQTWQSGPDQYTGHIDWYEMSMPTNKISLIHNPPMRLNKEPWILSEMSALLRSADHTISVQSPYLIPTRQMMNYIDFADTEAELVIVTNSVAASPNYFAMSGYIKHRKAILERTDHIYEYHGPGSLHTKSYIIDLRLSLIGSFNTDARSSFLGTESMIVVDSEPFALKLQSHIDQITRLCLPADQALMSDSGLVKPRHLPWYKNLAIRILFVLLYPFDFLL